MSLTKAIEDLHIEEVAETNWAIEKLVLCIVYLSPLTILGVVKLVELIIWSAQHVIVLIK